MMPYDTPTNSAARTITVRYAPTIINKVEGIIRGYVAVWGDLDHRDSYGTFFDREAPPEMGLDFAPFAIMYEHGYDGAVKKDIVGSITRVWFDETGIAFEARLDKTNENFTRVVEEIEGKELRTSSSTGDHTAEFDADGRFQKWLLLEVSLTKSPAEDRIPVVTLVRSHAPGRDALGDGKVTPAIPNRKMNPIQEMRNMFPDGMTMEEVLAQLLDEYTPEELIAQLEQMQQPAEAMPAASPMQADIAPADNNVPPDAAANAVDAVADPAAALTDVIDAVVSVLPQEAIDQLTPAMQQAVKAVKDRQNGRSNGISAAQFTQLLGEVKAMRSDMKRNQMSAPPAASPRRSAPANSVTVSEPRQFWPLDFQAMMFTHQVIRARNQQPSQEFMQTLAGRTADMLAKHDPMVDNRYVRSLLRGTRADEIVTSTNTGNGDEWIGVNYSGTLWEKARNNRIFQELVSKGMRVEEVPQGHESTVIFTEGSDPTVYTITQSEDLDATSRPTVVVPVTAPGTGQTTLTPGYLGMAIAYTSVFEEDSLIAAAPQLTAQMNEKAEETIEQLFINGDTASSANVNYDGGTANAAQYFLASNGARKYALVTGSGTSRDGGTLDENDFRLTLKLFPSAIRTRKQNIAFVIDSDTHNTALDILAIKTQDVRGTNATIDSGVLQNIYGVDVLESGFLPLTASDGKVTYNAAGTLGTILGVYAPFWAMGWKRRVMIETSKDILAQTNLIVATFRLGFVPRGAGAAVASYNLTIA